MRITQKILEEKVEILNKLSPVEGGKYHLGGTYGKVNIEWKYDTSVTKSLMYGLSNVEAYCWLDGAIQAVQRLKGEVV